MVFADASVIIPLAKAGKLSLLRKLFTSVKITPGIASEISVPGKDMGELGEAISTWMKIGKNQKTANARAAKMASLEGISRNDALIMIAAQSSKEILLTNDLKIHKVAKSLGIETRWLTSILLECAKKGILEKEEANGLLLDLMEAGMWLNPVVFATLEKKIDEI